MLFLTVQVDRSWGHSDNVTKQSVYASFKLGDFTFELLNQYAEKGYRISINENRKLKFESELETVNVDDNVSIRTHPDLEYDITVPADAFLKTPQENALYAELLELLPAVVRELSSVDDVHSERIKQMFELIGDGYFPFANICFYMRPASHRMVSSVRLSVRLMIPRNLKN